MKLSWKDLWLWRVGTGIAALMLCVNTYAIAGMSTALIVVAVCLAFIHWTGRLEIDRAKHTTCGTLPLWFCVLAFAPSHIIQLSGGRAMGFAGLFMLLALMGLCTLHDLPLVHARFPPPKNPRAP